MQIIQIYPSAKGCHSDRLAGMASYGLKNMVLQDVLEGLMKGVVQFMGVWMGHHDTL